MASRLEILFRSSHAPEPSALIDLTGDELGAIREMALGVRPTSDRHRAIDLIGAARPPEATATLVQLLRPTEPVGVRAAAAVYLGRIGGSQAEAALTRIISETDDPLLLAKIASGLARCGTPTSLPSLERLEISRDRVVQQLAKFATAVVAYRHDVPGHDLEAPSSHDLIEPPQQRRQAVSIRPSAPDEVAHVLAWIRQDAFGLNLAPGLSQTLDCQPSRLLILFDHSATINLFEHLFARRRLAALVANRAQEGGSYSVRWLVLTTPRSRDRVDCTLCRTDGVQSYYGTLDRSPEGARFTLKGVAGAGVIGALLMGSIEPTGFRIEEAWSDLGTRSRRSPIQAGPPPRP